MRFQYSGIDVTIRDEKGRLTTQDLSAFGDPSQARLVSVRDAAGQTTRYSYNALGSLTRVSPPEGPDRVWVFNEKNQLVSETHPENGTMLFTYDPAGNLLTRQDAQFGVTRFSYDRDNRLLSIDRPGEDYDTSFGYDASDNRTAAVNRHVDSAFSYDAVNRLVKRFDRIGGRTFETRYAYDDNGNLDALTYPSGGKVTYQYDGENRITRVANGGGGVVFARAFAYHPSGALDAFRAGNSLLHRFTYDDRYRLKTLNSGGELSLGYSYDRVGNVLGITDSRSGMNQTFSYDSLDRLETASGVYGALGFGYDASGNRRTKSAAAGTTSYAYDAGTNRLLEATGAEPASFSYDSNGNAVEDAAGQYTYTPSNQVETATVAGVVTTYRYDGDEFRKVKASSGETRYFVHGPGGQILSEFLEEGSGVSLVRDYVYAGSRLIASIKPAVLTVTPASVTFGVVAGGPEPAVKSLAVDVAGVAGKSWTAASSGATWLTLLDTAGTTPGTLRIGVDPTGLDVGAYDATVTVKSSGVAGSPKAVPVRLVVTAAPELSVVPASASFFMSQGGSSPAPQTVDVAYTGGDPVAWTAAATAPWLSVSPAAGATPGSITLSVNGSGLAKGTYTDVVTVEAASVPGGTRTISVQLVVQSAGGEACDPEAWYCEPFDELALGDLDGQGGWERIGSNATSQVRPDPRGAGRVIILDAPDDGFVKEDLFLAPRLIEGSSYSIQVMTRDVKPGSKSVAKIQFLTREDRGWSKNKRTFATLRVGARLVFQYGESISQSLGPMESGRWYEVRLVYQGGQVLVYVDGQLRFSTESEIAPDLTFEGFTNTAWPFPGLAGFDMIQAWSPPESLLVVQPLALSFTHPEGGRCPGPSPEFAAPATAAASVPGTGSSPGTRWSSRTGSAHLPVVFEPNLGQAEKGAAFISRGPGYNLMLQPTEFRLALARPIYADKPRMSVRAPTAAQGWLRSDLRVAFRGAMASRLEGMSPLPGRSHYFVGQDPRSWVAGVSQYRQVRYREVYPGVDLVFRGDDGRLEYDWIVSPGADLRRIEMQILGSTDVKLLEEGHLVITSPGGPVRMERPYIYQETDGGRREISGRYVKLDPMRIGFAVDSYDRSAPLVIDPVLTYSTFFSASSARRAAVDDEGNIYVAGVAPALDDRLSAPSLGPQGNSDIAITKLDPTGSTRLLTSYIGGSGNDVPEELALGPEGSMYVAGWTMSTDFPTVAGPRANYGGGHSDGFLARLSPDGTSLVYSTYLGGSKTDVLLGLSTDTEGSAYVVGGTDSPDFPVADYSPDVRAYQRTLRGSLCHDDDNQSVPCSDAFASKLTAAGELQYSTYFGGTAGETAHAVAVDSEGNAYLTGSTNSIDLPVVSVIQPYNNPFPNNAVPFATKLNRFGSGLVYSSWLAPDYAGGTPAAIAVDGAGAAYVAGSTDRIFPTTPGAFQETIQGYSWNGFALKISPGGNGFEWSTLLGTSTADFAGAIGVDAAGRAYVGGYTLSASFPIPGCFQAFGGGADGWVVSLAPDGSALNFGTYLGGDGVDVVTDLAVGPSGDLYVVGGTGSANMPTVNALPDAGPGAFIARIDPSRSVAGAGTIYLDADAGGVEVNETAGAVALTVRRSCGPQGAVGVTYKTEAGTAQEGVNYGASTGSIAFLDGDTTAQAIQVPILVDQKLTCEEPLTFDLSLDPATVTGGAWLGNPRVTIRIRDDSTVTVLEGAFAVFDAMQSRGPEWQAATDSTWLTLDTYSGVGPSTVKVYVDTSGLAAGDYTGRVTVTSPALGSPQYVDIFLTITPSYGGGEGMASAPVSRSGRGVRR